MSFDMEYKISVTLGLDFQKYLSFYQLVQT